MVSRAGLKQWTAEGQGPELQESADGLRTPWMESMQWEGGLMGLSVCTWKSYS